MMKQGRAKRLDSCAESQIRMTRIGSAPTAFLKFRSEREELSEAGRNYLANSFADRIPLGKTRVYDIAV